MSTWLNGQEPPYMADEEKKRLTCEQVAHAAACLTYSSARYAAAAAILMLTQMGYSPAQINAFLHEDTNQLTALAAQTAAQ